MKRIVMVAGLMWGQGLVAQPVNYGNNNSVDGSLSRSKDKQEYIDGAKTRWNHLQRYFDQRKRQKDPFGMELDPGVLKVEKVAAIIPETKPEEAAPLKVVLLQDAVDRFNLIFVLRRLVLERSRLLYVDDRFEIELEGEVFRLRITKITADEVEFINTKNQEKMSVPIGKIRSK